MEKELVSRRNRTILLSMFENRLTRWIEYDELKDITQDFLKDNAKGYGVDFVIKRNNVNKKYAVFIHKKNKLKRKEDKKLKTTLGELMINAMPMKREGISILKSMSMIGFK